MTISLENVLPGDRVRHFNTRQWGTVISTKPHHDGAGTFEIEIVREVVPLVSRAFKQPLVAWWPSYFVDEHEAQRGQYLVIELRSLGMKIEPCHLHATASEVGECVITSPRVGETCRVVSLEYEDDEIARNFHVQEFKIANLSQFVDYPGERGLAACALPMFLMERKPRIPVYTDVAIRVVNIGDTPAEFSARLIAQKES